MCIHGIRRSFYEICLPAFLYARNAIKRGRREEEGSRKYSRYMAWHFTVNPRLWALALGCSLSLWVAEKCILPWWPHESRNCEGSVGEGRKRKRWRDGTNSQIVLACSPKHGVGWMISEITLKCEGRWSISFWLCLMFDGYALFARRTKFSKFSLLLFFLPRARVTPPSFLHKLSFHPPESGRTEDGVRTEFGRTGSDLDTGWPISLITTSRWLRSDRPGS